MILWYLLITAFVLRVSVGITFFFLGVPAFAIQPQNWWESGYSHYGIMAINFAEGKGLHLGDPDTGFLWAARPPLYPLLLAMEYLLFGQNNIVPILLQAVIGAGTVLLTYLIARVIFGKQPALVAAVMTTGYPYYVAHDTAHQETVLFTFLTAAALYCLVRARCSGALRDHVLAGWCLGLVLLCRESILPFVPLGILWLYFTCSIGKGVGSRARIGALLMAIAIVVVPWLIRNTLIYGKPVFTTGEGFGPGFRLWVGYNEFTLTHYPWGSIDKSTALAYEALSLDELAELSRLGELESDQWFLRRALGFIRQNPATALKYAIIKVLAGFSPIISPTVGSRLRGTLYMTFYLPLLILGIMGGVLARNRWQTLSIFYLLFLSFMGASVVAHAHTSHRSYLDLYLMILASHALVWLLQISCYTARRVFAPLPD